MTNSSDFSKVTNHICSLSTDLEQLKSTSLSIIDSFSRQVQDLSSDNADLLDRVKSLEKEIEITALKLNRVQEELELYYSNSCHQSLLIDRYEALTGKMSSIFSLIAN